MRRRLIAGLAGVFVLAGAWMWIGDDGHAHAATCVGADPCKACRSCTSCAHCKGGKAKCGTCKPKDPKPKG